MVNLNERKLAVRNSTFPSLDSKGLDIYMRVLEFNTSVHVYMFNFENEIITDILNDARQIQIVIVLSLKLLRGSRPEKFPSEIFSS